MNHFCCGSVKMWSAISCSRKCITSLQGSGRRQPRPDPVLYSLFGTWLQSGSEVTKSSWLWCRGHEVPLSLVSTCLVRKHQVKATGHMRSVLKTTSGSRSRAVASFWQERNEGDAVRFLIFIVGGSCGEAQGASTVLTASLEAWSDADLKDPKHSGMESSHVS